MSETIYRNRENSITVQLISATEDGYYTGSLSNPLIELFAYNEGEAPVSVGTLTISYLSGNDWGIVLSEELSNQPKDAGFIFIVADEIQPNMVDIVFSENIEPDPQTNQIVWNIKKDLGSSTYNSAIKIRIKAEATFNFNTVSIEKTKELFFKKSTSDLNSNNNTRSPFPREYSGTSGTSLLRNKPRL